MKKYFLNNGEEVKFGDIINATKDEGRKKTIVTCLFDVDSIDFLKELGILIEKDIEKEDTKKQDSLKEESANIVPYINYINYVFDYVAAKLGISRVDAMIYLDDLKKINPLAALAVYLKRIAYKLNKKYDKTPIRSLSEIFVISIYSGKVIEINPKSVENLSNFAWFRTREDAEFARKCVINLIEKMFGKDDQSKD